MWTGPGLKILEFPHLDPLDISNSWHVNIAFIIKEKIFILILAVI